MGIKVYRKTDTNAVYLAHGIIGTWPFNTLRAVANLSDNTVDIHNNSKTANISVGDENQVFHEVRGIPYTEFENEEGVAYSTLYGDSVASVVNTLNKIFENLPLVEAAPTISSPLSISVGNGELINYVLECEPGTAINWGTLPNGLAISPYKGNIEILGIIQDGTGIYNVDVDAVNVYGITSATLVINVTSDFSNGKSILFNNSEYLNATANSSNPLYRASNGAGAGDAWTISLWFKRGTSTKVEQTILSFGGGTKQTEGGLHLSYNGTTNAIHFYYGTSSDYLRLTTPDSVIEAATWHHVFITYDGGTTGSDAGSIADYYGRFEIWIDGVSQTLTKENGNNGFSGEIVADYFRIGQELDDGNNMRDDCKVDEVAIWGSDQTANVASIYSGGTPDDLSALGTPPDHWWRMGDGDTFPTIADQIASLDFTMINMVITDIVNDAPS